MKFILTIYKFDINGMIYIGSTWDFDKRIREHKCRCYNENDKRNHCKLYKHIRNNNIEWDNINVECIYTQELNEKNKLLKRQTEQIYIDKYDSKNNGLNHVNAYISKEDYLLSKKKYREIHRDRYIKYREDSKEKHKEYIKVYNEEHKEEIKEKKRKYYEKHKEEISEKCKDYCKNHKEEIKEYNKVYNEKHKEELKEKKRKYYEKHKERIKEKSRLRHQHKKNEKMCGEILNELINNLF